MRRPGIEVALLLSMEIQDGFIVGIFNYCDRWCDRCPFTSRCRVFADIAEEEFERDHGPLTEPMHEREARKMAEHAERWEKELGIDFAKIDEEAEKEIAKDPEGENEPGIRSEHLELNERARDFSGDVHQWLMNRGFEDHDGLEALEVIAHFRFFIAGKVYRALIGLRNEERFGECNDKEGSAKAAMVGLERMRAAWEKLVALSLVQRSDVASSLIDTANWMIAELDRVLPNARSFVRPGFDEPEEMKKLEALEREPLNPEPLDLRSMNQRDGRVVTAPKTADR